MPTIKAHPLRRVARGLASHVRRQWPAYACSALAFSCAHAHYRLGVNMSHSLPDHLYLIEVGIPPTGIGDLVAFRWQRTAFYRPERIFVKEVRGIAGQMVTVQDRTVYVDGVRQAVAKPRSRHGFPLQPALAGIIPCGYLFVATDHPDSLDSRYRVTGLVGPDRLIGRAHVIF